MQFGGSSRVTIAAKNTTSPSVFERSVTVTAENTTSPSVFEQRVTRSLLKIPHPPPGVWKKPRRINHS
jgi:hypothetical protein